MAYYGQQPLVDQKPTGEICSVCGVEHWKINGPFINRPHEECGHVHGLYAVGGKPVSCRAMLPNLGSNG